MKIAIAGYGIEGANNYRHWSKDPNNKIVIVDQRNPDINIPDGVQSIISQDVFEKLQGFDLVIRTAGLAPRKIKTDGKIWSSTNEFFCKCPAQIIGVTGTKGKGTTASLIASILQAAGKKVWLLGNIGKPPLDVLDQINPTDFVVFELSSFQLWDLEKSPHIAVILFIDQEHMDVHLDMAEYVTAKANITKYQTNDDILVYNKDNAYSSSIAFESKAITIPYMDQSFAHISDGYFYYGEQKICSVSALGIVGKFNYENACAAIDAVWQITNDTKAIEKGLSDFKGLPHRLQLVRELDGVGYYDDSIATIPGAAIAALKAFDGPKVIILGGSSKHSDFTLLGVELTKQDVSAILIGDEALKIEQACLDAGFKNYKILANTTMSEVVNLAKNLSKPGGVILLSPACASFGMFKNYADRGDQFQTAVSAL